MMLTPRSLFEASPFGDLFRLTDELARRPRAPRVGAPTLTARHDERAVHVRVELPGLTSEDLDLSVEGDQLEISGDLPALDVPEGSSVHQRERSTGRFQHRLTLPYRVDAEQAKAHLEHGVLELELPRVAEEQPRRIEIQSRS